MANPFGALGSVNVMQVVQDTLQRQANIRNQQILGDYRQQEMQMKQQEMDLQKQFRDQQLRGLLLDPTRENPETTSIATSDQDNVQPEQRVLRDLRAERTEAANNMRIAQAYGMDTKPWVTRLDSIDTNIREAQKDASKKQSEQSQQAAQVLRDVDSGASAAAALQHINDNISPQLARKIYNALPQDEQGGIIWNETAKQALKPYASQFTSMHESSMQNYRATEVKLQGDKLEQKKKEDDETKRYHDREISVRQAGIAAANKRAQMVMDRAGMGMDYKLLKDTQSQVDKIASDYKIRDYQKGVEVADTAVAKLTDPKRGFADVSPPEARTLADQFKLMIDNYRSRTGGKYQEAELAHMNGLLQRLDKFTESIGRGDMILAKDTMLQTAQQMQKLYTDRASDLAKEELTRAKNLRARGTDSTLLTLHADVDDLERRGVVKKVQSEGKDYVLFPKPGALNKKKRTAEDFDAVEMPSRPDESKRPYPVFIEGDR